MAGHRLASRVDLGGLVVAGVGFFLTRFTVSLAVYDHPMQFLLVGVVPLAAGLTVAAFGVALAVGAFGARYAWTVAAWCVAGAGSMAVLVALTLYGVDPGSLPTLETVRTRAYLANFLIGGCVGGTLTGVYAARTANERRAQRDQAKRMVVLNRVFRDRVLNAVTAIRGHVDLLYGSDDPAARERAYEVVHGQSDDLEESVAEIRQLTRSSPAADGDLEAVDVVATVEERLATARARYPGARIDLVAPESAPAWAGDLLGNAVDRLVENAVEHSDAETPTLEVAVRRRGDAVSIVVADDGPGLPPVHQRMLATGSVEEYDDPTVGFGLNLVTLLVESYGGRVEAAVTDDGTTITLTLSAADEGARSPSAADLASPGVSKARVGLACIAALGAGAVMGLVGNALTGLVPVIGVLYGVEDAVVGWVTHEFHSVVFGVVYVGLLAVAPRRYRDSLRGQLAVAVGWALFLWLVAIGVVMPVWLRLLGIPAPIPNVSTVALVTHLVWGVSLGLLYAAGHGLVADRTVDLDLWRVLRTARE